MMEFAKRFTTDEVWPKGILDAHPGYRGKSLFDVLFRNGNVNRFPLSEVDPGYANHQARHFGFSVQKALVAESAPFPPGHGHDPPPHTPTPPPPRHRRPGGNR